MCFVRYASGATDRQTDTLDTLIAILHTHAGSWHPYLVMNIFIHQHMLIATNEIKQRNNLN